MWQLTLHDLLEEGGKGANGLIINRFPCVLGRHSECDYRFNSPFLSRRQCVFFLKDDQVWVADLASRNGTLLNGKPLQDELPLNDGDELNLAGFPFRVCLTAQAAASDEPHRVLVVEDDEDAAETLAVLLKRWGHDVHVAHNGPEALKAARAHQPDTVLVDIRLPGMDGYEVAERLRRQPGAEPALMVAMSGHEGEKTRPQSDEAQFDEFLIKPVDTRMLQEVFAR